MAYTVIKFTDMEEENRVEMDFDLTPDETAQPTDSLTAAMVMTLGVKMLFTSGDVWEAGLIAAQALHEGKDPMEMAREIAAQRKAPVEAQEA